MNINKRASFDNPSYSHGNAPGSYLNTINPFSRGLELPDRIPDWFMKLFPASAGSRDAAAMTFKIGACSLLAAGLVGGARMLTHFSRIKELKERDNPAKKLVSQVGTTFSGKMDPDSVVKTASKKDDGKWGDVPSLSWGNAFSMALPLGATLLAAGLAYKAADSFASNRRENILNNALAGKSEAVKKLLKARAMNAKNNITENDLKSINNSINSDDVYVKEASLAKSALSPVQHSVSVLGLLGSALLLASAIGSYSYFKASDENNIRYKAIKKGLNEYAKGKAGISNVYINPEDAKDYFNAIDSGSVATTDIRKQPETDSSTLNNPISVTL